MTSQDTLLARYSIDTSALISPWRDSLPPRRFKTFWKEYTNLFDSGQAIAVDEVHLELRKREGDDLLEWVKHRPASMFVALDSDIQMAALELLEKSDKLLGTHKGRNAADPWVIALAMARGLAVVTCELPSGTDRRPKIPDVCDALGIPWLGIVDLCDAEHWDL
ncbi:MAG TPA: DUF4411 family protein [Thermoleophilia bacterium]